MGQKWEWIEDDFPKHMLAPDFCRRVGRFIDDRNIKSRKLSEDLKTLETLFQNSKMDFSAEIYLKTAINNKLGHELIKTIKICFELP